MSSLGLLTLVGFFGLFGLTVILFSLPRATTGVVSVSLAVMAPCRAKIREAGTIGRSGPQKPKAEPFV